GLAGNNQLVTVVLEVFAQQTTEVDLGAAIGRSVVVGQVEMIDAQVEGGAQQGALGVDRRAVAEVVPQAQRQRRQHQPAATNAAVRNGVVAISSSDIGHRTLYLFGVTVSWNSEGRFDQD